MRNWPRTFKQYIDDRKEELLEQKKDLCRQMEDEIKAVKVKIEGYQTNISEVLQIGLTVNDTFGAV